MVDWLIFNHKRRIPQLYIFHFQFYICFRPGGWDSVSQPISKICQRHLTGQIIPNRRACFQAHIPCRRQPEGAAMRDANFRRNVPSFAKCCRANGVPRTVYHTLRRLGSCATLSRKPCRSRSDLEAAGFLDDLGPSVSPL